MFAPSTRTRLAPTPSGYLHLGNLFSFVLTAGLARSTGARILLRIDDLDQQRVRKEYIRDVFEILDFFNIPWDEGPRNEEAFEKEYSQVHRTHLYNAALNKLRSTGMIFACECSRSLLQQAATAGCPGSCLDKNIPLEKPGVNWRLRTNNLPITIQDHSGRSHTCAFPASMRDFIIRKKDGQAAYQLASVCDDMYFGVNLIVRGEDLMDSSLAQLYLASLLPEPHFQEHAFCHHRLLTGADAIKLSKSAGAGSIYYLRKTGKTRAEILTLLLHQLGVPGTAETWEELAAILLADTALWLSCDPQSGLSG
ncbi:MAG TPA: glutamate--tRNA ligase family protein [Sediminibacterium sp.]|nr:glutamate--tRNA ligase family protein [Sediminibacterium sp.]